MTLPFRHFLLALAVVAIWGSNFVVIRWGLNAFPPLLFAALRFTLATLPAIFLLPRPQVSWRNLAAYGSLVGVAQFSLLYLAMGSQISPGLASLVIQTQVFFTLMLAMRTSGERVQPFQWLALLMAACGIGIIASHTDGSTTVLGLAMVLLAAFSWASGNVVGKRAVGVNMLAYVVWSSAFAAPALLVLSLAMEGPQRIATAFSHAGLGAWGAVIWQAAANTLFGYGAWSWLLSRHPAATVVPMALLVPIFGMSCSALLLGEGLPPWKLIAAALVMSGLAINLLWPRMRQAWRLRSA
ncbi:EamA family transporter [Roseateles sp. SL47]|jgi:O-acetylserine/cysteine efflux transporter|uniref:EamA family transporter n=1 Tax=Roseateles sp. SL47 TaxID=2995138 RepID=UPI00226F2961|nr:EamA family transporter [Roseateles sp. SL47]WAC73707.1 EamA family transporter [Roseateles sp. SL47]